MTTTDALPLKAEVDALRALVLALGAQFVRSASDPAAALAGLREMAIETRCVADAATAETAWKELDIALNGIAALASDVIAAPR